MLHPLVRVVEAVTLLLLLALALAGCGRWRYLPGYEAAETACARSSRATDWSIPAGLLGGFLASSTVGAAQAPSALARMEDCMTAAGWPPGTAIRERVR